ncbi:hypothetical protein [Kitasatospora viridis]|uniref:Allene oxide cyclase barrel-like domain-containing protein n=1 Tax=Kitasatospora viridis TaxID=281105 RepID=A0A561UI24_9ACTN|nr:hypothetical protein [Kitasatospora viridis]TWF99018.1 hypothetical protein FHX73_112853 [Kitasatospora viridis]
MQRVTIKRSVGFAVAGLVVGTVGALSVPALADNAPAAHRVAPVQALTLDFSGTNDEASTPQAVGTTFGGRGIVKDTTGAKIGEVYDICAKGAINANADTVFCTGTIRITGQGEISFSAVLPISDNASAPDEHGFTGVVNGGTRAYEGITGEAQFQPRAQAVYDLNFA